MYGGWTSLDNKNNDRLRCTIDSDPVCELDIKASQPTLLSCLLGHRMGRLDAGDEWSDAYAELSSLWAVNTWWSQLDPLISTGDLIERNRKVAKAVVMELIGSGSSLKFRATKELTQETGLTEYGWTLFREQLTRTIPALAELEPRYDKDGKVSGYINGAGFLSYHESEMTLQAVEALMGDEIPAYPIHDCLLVKVSDANKAARVYRDTIRQYCRSMGGLDVLVPLSCKVDKTTTSEPSFKPEELIERYLS